MSVPHTCSSRNDAPSSFNCCSEESEETARLVPRRGEEEEDEDRRLLISWSGSRIRGVKRGGGGLIFLPLLFPLLFSSLKSGRRRLLTRALSAFVHSTCHMQKRGR